MTPPSRRLYLSVTLKLMVLAGGLVLVATLIASIGGTRESGTRQAEPWRLEIDWAAIPPGEYRERQWPDGRRIGVYRRTPAQVARLAGGEHALVDPRSRHSHQPADLNPAWRSRHREVFVFFPRETRRGCRVRLERAGGRFIEACFGARFDSAGRRLRGSGVDGQQNLPVPDYVLQGQRLQLIPPEEAG